MILLIRGGIPIDRSLKLQHSDILIDDSRIARIAPSIDVPEGTTILEAEGSLVVLGLINAHTHAHNNLAKGWGAVSIGHRNDLSQLLGWFHPAERLSRSVVELARIA